MVGGVEGVRSIVSKPGYQPTMSKYALPTTDEMRQLHAADQSSVFQSNFFKLQVDQLLEEVTIDYSSFSSVNAVLFALKEALDAIPEQQVTSQALNMPGLVVHHHHKEVVLPFHPPARLDVVGSYSLRHGILLDHTFTIDVAIHLPDECFVPKDFTNYRYHDKRNMYLGVLASHLQTPPKGKTSKQLPWTGVSVAPFAGDTSKPILRLHLPPIKKTQVVVQLIPVVSFQCKFPVSKLHPGKSNLRHDPPLDATPVYNNSVLEDMALLSHFRALHAVAAQSESFVQACILIKVWLRQRQATTCAPDALNGFQATMLMLYLIRSGKFSYSTPADAMVKIWLQFVATTDLATTALVFPAASSKDMDGLDEDIVVMPTPAGVAAFQRAFDVVFLDPSGRVNVVSRVSRTGWRELQWLAQQSIQVLPKATAEAFQFIFIDRHSFWTRYDEYIWVPVSTSVVQNVEIPGDLALPNDLERVVAKALGDRVHRIRPVAIKPSATTWALTETPPSIHKVVIGLGVNPDNAHRIVDKGPEADNAVDAAAFRAFWKTKAELRRFKDGSIVEAVVWDDVPPSQIVSQIVHTILPLHFDDATVDGRAIVSSNQTWNEVDYSINPLLRTWTALQSKLRDLDDTILPLKVVDLQLIAPALRRTAADPPTPHPLAGNSDVAPPQGAKFVTTTLEPYTVVMQFETSSSWPTTPDAVANAKLGFYVQIALALEKFGACEVHEHGMDILVGGFPFRVVIVTEREKNWPHSHFYALHYGALHAKMIHAVSTQHSAFAPTVRLWMKWLDAHLATSLLPLESSELLVASVFLSPAPPQSVLSGFTRVLHLVARFDWNTQPLIVDLHQHFTEDDRRDIQKQFTASRSSPSTHPALYIAASYETAPKTSFWTRHVHEPVLAQRLVSLAKATSAQWTHWLAHGAAPHGWQACFAHVMDYDVVFHLAHLGNKDVFPSAKGRFAIPFYKNLKQSNPFGQLFVGLHPLEDVLSALHARFDHLALFFVNQEVVAVRWKPAAFLPARFRVLHATHLLALSSDNDANHDKLAVRGIPQVLTVLQEMKAMLHGLVDRVELK
ncbi:hypothetical protein H310_08042 [Aphanomyces invadans]|uniref:U3 small nucleolar RNA-associated protein 22 n=1 Tax=Aphanomyces invadans TaxID=157072 RepID=A0A024TYS6_9STRA|nr:hypothetical protein H310_08042 [Aphanomyces invadans]ETV99310.1 hypothetical protein H310_08042 [Aphanomyces invadans]|eukprot:XP_008871866.1 hypothetical protein H310_08042 [Aphanomyces invadans]